MTNPSARQVAEWVSGQVDGDDSVPVCEVSRIEDYTSLSLSFLADLKYEKYLYHPAKRSVLVPSEYAKRGDTGSTLIRVKNVYESYALAVGKLDAVKNWEEGISTEAYISKSARVDFHTTVSYGVYVGPEAFIGRETIVHPQVYIGPGVRVGERCTIYPGVRIMKNCHIGNDVIIHANAVIGSDGFGFGFEQGRYVKIPQLGIVIIEDEVEIGANSCIDRAALGVTRIGKGTKIDNLVQVGHNAQVGEHIAIAAQAGISGSAKIGSGSQLGGQSGIAGHIEVAPGSRIQAQAGVAADLETGNRKWHGSPAMPYFSFLRAFKVFRILPQLVKRLEHLESIIGISDKNKE